MKVDQQSRTGRIGVSAAQLAFEELGFIFREQPIQDLGIDAHIEIVNDGEASGKLIALQIKSGESSLEEKTNDSIIFRADLKHLLYWLSHSLPVMVIIYDPMNKVAYWQIVSEHTAIKTGKGWKMYVPLTQQVNNLSVDLIKQHAKKLSTSNNYTIISLKDTSHGMAKRYSANILLNKECTKPELIELIKDITEELKYREYYRNELVTQRWEGRCANVVWLFIALSLDDIDLCNWICKTQWIDEDLDPQCAPLKFEGEISENGIIIDWNKNYEEHSQFFNTLRMSKEDFLKKMGIVLSPTKNIVSQTIPSPLPHFNRRIDSSKLSEVSENAVNKITIRQLRKRF